MYQMETIKHNLLRLQYKVYKEDKTCPMCQSERRLFFHTSVDVFGCYTCMVHYVFENTEESNIANCPPDAHEDRNNNCDQKSPGGFICTREPGHSGSHHAHGTKDCYEVWE